MKRRGVIVEREAAVSRAGYWQGHIRACESSGLSIAGYCRQQGFSTSSYYRWKRVLRTCSVSGASETAPVAAAFAEVAVAPPVSDARAAIEVVGRGGRAIRIWPGFDAPTLLRVLEVVEGLGC